MVNDNEKSDDAAQVRASQQAALLALYTLWPSCTDEIAATYIAQTVGGSMSPDVNTAVRTFLGLTSQPESSWEARALTRFHTLDVVCSVGVACADEDMVLGHVMHQLQLAGSARVFVEHVDWVRAWVKHTLKEAATHRLYPARLAAMRSESRLELERRGVPL